MESSVPRLRIMEVEHADASAGWARRVAMDAAADWLDEEGAGDGVLMTSDADSRVASDWVRKTMGAVACGADAVAGRIVLDEDEARRLPASLHKRGRREAAYERLLTEIGARLDPEPGDPCPAIGPHRAPRSRSARPSTVASAACRRWPAARIAP